MKFPNLLKASNSEAIDAIIEGLAVDQNGYFLTEEQAAAIENNLAGHAASLAAANENLTAAQTAQQAAEQSLATANATIQAQQATITAHEATIAERDARIAEMEKGGSIKQTSRENDGSIKVAFHESEDNPFNQLRNQVFPAAKK